MNIKFKQWECSLVFGRYENDRVAIQLIDANDYQPIAVATVNLPEVDLADGYVIIKDYSENEGMLETLIDSGIIAPPIEAIKLGWVVVFVCELLISAP